MQAIVDATPRLDELSTARLIQLIAEAAHGKTVALSPNSIVVEPDGKIRLDAAALTAPSYASPEKLKGGATDRRSDVFSVGVLMWEALSHEKLFEAGSVEALTAIVQELEPRPPSESNANIPSELDAIVLKALAKDPGARYQSLKVMAAEIDAVLSDAGYAETNELITKFLGGIQRAPAIEVKAPILPKVTPREPAKPAGLDPKAAEAKKAEEAKKLDETRKAEEARVAEARRVEAKRLEDARKAEEIRRAEDARVAEAKKAEDARRAAEAKKAAEEMKRAADAKKAEEAKAEAKRAEDARIAEATRKMEEAARATEAARAAEAARLAEAKRAEEEKKAAAAAEAAKTAAAEAAAAIEAAKAAAARAAEAIKAAETAQVSRNEASKAAEVAQAESVKADSAKHVATPRTISSTLPAHTIAEPKLDPSGFDPARSALGAPAAGSDTRPLTKAELNRTMLGVAPGPELVRPASSSQPPPMGGPAVLTDTPVVGLPAVPPGAEPASLKPALKPPVKPDDIHDAMTQRVPKRGKSETAGKKFDKNKKKGTGEEKTTKFEKSDPTPADAAGGATSRAHRESGKIDVWFSSTDSVATVHEDDEFEPHKTRNPLVYIGGAVAAAVVVIVVAIAFSGGSKDKDAKKGGSGSAIAAAKPAEPPTPLVPDPGVGSAPGSAVAVGSGSAELTPPPPTPPPPPAPKSAGMACAATTECADGLSCEAGACAAPKPIPVVKPPEPKKPPDVVKPPEPKKPPDVAKLPEPKKPPAPPIAHAKPADPYPDVKPKVDPQEALKTGLQQYARGETGAALATFRGAISANPGFSPAYRGMGLVYEKMGNKAQARIAYKKYLQLAPTAGDADQIRERMERL